MKKIKVKRNKTGLTLDLTQYNILGEALEELNSLFEEQKEFWLNASVELFIDLIEINNSQIEALINLLNLYQVNITKIIINNSSIQSLLQQYNFTTEIINTKVNTNTTNIIPGNSIEQQTLYIQASNNVALRSGQKVQYDGNIIIIGDVNDGCQIFATGSIIIHGKLAGDVHAGWLVENNELLETLYIKALKIQDPVHINIGHYSASSLIQKDKKILKQKIYPETLKIQNNKICRMPDFQ